jgi:serine/threonine protein kinase/tetratricopeptide (TPR) repeat protein
MLPDDPQQPATVTRGGASATDDGSHPSMIRSLNAGDTEPVGYHTESGAVESDEPTGLRSRPRWPRATTLQISNLPLVHRDYYVVTGELARGGMGRVLTAKDRRTGRPVVLKELLSKKPSARRRFEREALITARLQHPAIVPVYEVGRWDDDEPFYAMKHVDGKTLDKLIDATTKLEERLELLPSLLAVADALAYTHSRQVVHRDLKPSNILVGSFGETVLIDWGLAKDMTAPEGESESGELSISVDDDALTVAGRVMGTPSYMPPEQAAGEPVTERADVYALGATLYHALSGTKPYAGGTKHPKEILAKLQAGPPAPLDEVEPRAPRELVALVSKAMARNPAERYETAQQFADDLRRFHTGQLVGVHRYTTWQLVQRWMSRNRATISVAAAAFVVLIVVVAFGASNIVSERAYAEEQRRAAERSRAEAEDLLSYMVGDLSSKLRPIGKLELLSSVATKARAYFENHAESLSIEGERKRSRAFEGVGHVLQAQGDTNGALAAFRAGQGIVEKLAAADPSDFASRRTIAVFHNNIGQVLAWQGDLVGALAEYRASFEISKALVVADPSNAGFQRDLTLSRVRVGQALQSKGDAPGALAEYLAALANAEELSAADPSNGDLLRDLSVFRNKVGDVLMAQGDLAAAHASYRSAQAVISSLVETSPADAHLKRDLVVSHLKIGRVLDDSGDLSGALTSFRAAIDVSTKLSSTDPSNAEWQRDLSIGLNCAGDVLLKHNKLDDALASFRAALAIVERLAASDPNNAMWQADVTITQERVGKVLTKKSDLPGALAMFRSIEAARVRLARPDPSNADAQFAWFAARAEVGNIQFAMGDPSGALATLERAIPIAERLAAEDPTNATWKAAIQNATKLRDQARSVQGKPYKLNR